MRPPCRPARSGILLPKVSAAPADRGCKERTDHERRPARGTGRSAGAPGRAGGRGGRRDAGGGERRRPDRGAGSVGRGGRRRPDRVSRARGAGAGARRPGPPGAVRAGRADPHRSLGPRHVGDPAGRGARRLGRRAGRGAGRGAGGAGAGARPVADRRVPLDARLRRGAVLPAAPGLGEGRRDGRHPRGDAAVGIHGRRARRPPWGRVAGVPGVAGHGAAGGVLLRLPSRGAARAVGAPDHPDVQPAPARRRRGPAAAPAGSGTDRGAGRGGRDRRRSRRPPPPRPLHPAPAPPLRRRGGRPGAAAGLPARPRVHPARPALVPVEGRGRRSGRAAARRGGAGGVRGRAGPGGAARDLGRRGRR